MFKTVTANDFYRVEGEVLPQLLIDDELIRLGGEGWDGFGFKVAVLKVLGYDVDNPPEIPVRVEVYNKIGASLNRLGDAVAAKSLRKDLGI